MTNTANGFEIPEYTDAADVPAIIRKNIETAEKITKELKEALTMLEKADAAHKSAAVLDHPDGSVTHEKLADNSVWTAQLGHMAVTHDNMGQNAVGTSNIIAGAVYGDVIKKGAITNDKMAENAVGNKNIMDAAITVGKLHEGAVTAEKIATGCITHKQIQDGAVTTKKIEAKAVENDKIADGAVTTAKIRGGAITHEKMAHDAVTQSTLANDSVAQSKIINGAVTEHKIANGAVTFDKLSSTLYTYSKTPVRIGTWVDGTPVWRAAIPLTPLATAGITHGTTKSIAMHTLLETLGIIARNNAGNMVYIDSMLRLQNATNDSSFIATPSNDAITESGIPGIYNIKWGSGEPALAIYGWCEFATPESNIA